MTYCSVVTVSASVGLNKEMLWPLCCLENFIPQINGPFDLLIDQDIFFILEAFCS